MALADIKTAATDKLDDGMLAAKRVIRQRTHDLQDLRDATALKVRRAPFQTLALAVGSGLMLGFVVGLVKGRAGANRVAKM